MLDVEPQLAEPVENGKQSCGRHEAHTAATYHADWRNGPSAWRLWSSHGMPAFGNVRSERCTRAGRQTRHPRRLACAL
jgi:hypothetical protein